MSKNNTVQILLTALDKGFSKAINQGKTRLGELGKKADTVKKKSLSGFGTALSKGLDQAINKAKKNISGLGKTADKVKTRLGKIKGAVVGIFAAVGTAVAALVVTSAKAAKETENFARIANMSSWEFRAYAYATKKVGIQMDKLADISKDVQDKLGDFIATGGGEFADFFENIAPKVGLTAKELQGLSGPDVLIAVKKAMDDANVSAEEQVFYLEAIGNDASLLIPLLKDEGKGFKEAAERARELGLALNKVDHENLIEAGNATNDATSAFVGLKNEIAAEFAPLFADVMRFSTKLIIDLKDEARRLAGTFVNVGESVKGWKAVIDGRLGFFEFATMDAKELDEWLKKNSSSVAELENKAGGSFNRIASNAKTSGDDQEKYTKDALKSMKKEYEKYVKEVNKLQDEIAGREQSLAEQLRSMSRTGMSDLGAWNDRKKEAQEYEAAAKKAAEAGDYPAAVELADKAKDAYKDLNEEVKAGDQVLVSQSEALKISMAGVESAGNLAIEALQKQKTAAQEAADALNDKSGGQFSGLDKSVDDTTTKIKSMDKIIIQVGNRFIDMWQDNRKTGIKVLDDLQAKLDKMDGQTIKYYVEEVKKKMLGGLIQKFATGGKLAGYGGGDKIPALLEAGEFIIRKEAVKYFGPGAFTALNSFRLPKFQTGGPVGAVAAAGVGGGETTAGGEEVTVKFDFSGATTQPRGKFSKSDLSEFVRLMKREQRLRS